MKIALRRIDRSNWREAIDLKVRRDQRDFVAPVTVSMAGAYVRRYGDHFAYDTMGIYDGDQMIGYFEALSDPSTAADYWIDDILIDERFQGRGYGRAAVIETIRFLLGAYPCCRTIMLSCHRDNHHAARLYLSLGFVATGKLNPTYGQPDYELTGAALDQYR